jgi:enterochelin esterase-like enzyme/ribosomal protein S18 acetylase RimI-like enzyme
MIAFRQISEADIPALVEISAAASAHNDQHRQGIPSRETNSASFLSRLRDNHAGWMALIHGQPVGFAMANRNTGELWIIAVRPEYQGQRIGRELMRQAEAWLFSHGWKEIWLSADNDERHREVDFFRRLGWRNSNISGNHRLKKSNPKLPFKLEEHAVSDRATGYERLLRVQRGPVDESHRLCLVLDGELYWRDMDAVPVLTELCNRGSIPAMTLAFVGHVSAAARHEDYTCNEIYGRYIANGVMKWLRAEIPNIRRGDHVIVGASLSGLMAAYLTLKYPEDFAYCLSQSGSHWWKHEWFAQMARASAPTRARFWLSVGDQETETNVKHPPSDLLQEISQIAGVNKVLQVLRQIGGTVHCHQYPGGHSVEHWCQELSQALPWLLAERSDRESRS